MSLLTDQADPTCKRQVWLVWEMLKVFKKPIPHKVLEQSPKTLPQLAAP